jgi:hypothetical protein
LNDSESRTPKLGSRNRAAMFYRVAGERDNYDGFGTITW